MPRILFQKSEIFVSEQSDPLWKFPVAIPEVRVGKVVQSGVQRPAP